MNKWLMGVGAAVAIVLVGAGVWYVGQNRVAQMPVAGEEMMEEKTEEGMMGTEMSEKGEGMMEGEVKEFVVEGSPFKFEPAVIRVKKGDRVRVVFKNLQGTHDFTIDEYEVATDQLSTGEEETVEFVAEEAGTFEYYCSVGNHRQLGMVGQLIVE